MIHPCISMSFLLLYSPEPLPEQTSKNPFGEVARAGLTSQQRRSSFKLNYLRYCSLISSLPRGGHTYFNPIWREKGLIETGSRPRDISRKLVAISPDCACTKIKVLASLVPKATRLIPDQKNQGLWGRECVMRAFSQLNSLIVIFFLHFVAFNLILKRSLCIQPGNTKPKRALFC